jgi:hypothetical protein
MSKDQLGGSFQPGQCPGAEWENRRFWFEFLRHASQSNSMPYTANQDQTKSNEREAHDSYSRKRKIPNVSRHNGVKMPKEVLLQ